MFGRTRVYADAAAATPLSPRARGEFERLFGVFGNAGALHKEALMAQGELARARKMVAQSIGAHEDEIIFVASGTEANNLAIYGAFREGRALTCAIEHQSVLEPLRHRGLPIVELPVDKSGVVLYADAPLEGATFASIQLVNSEVGTIEPVREIVKFLKKRVPGIVVHTDASQAPLWMDIKVERLGVDLMTLDAQKVLGPKGVGCLYVKRGVRLGPLLRGGKQEQGLRGGTENVPAIGAFAVALEDAQRDVEARVKHVAAVRDFLWSEITRLLPGALLNGPALRERAANNLNVSVPGLEADMAVVAMDALGVAVSTRSACNTGDEEPSHVIKALGVPPDLAGTAIRITLLPSASKRDARRIATALSKVAARYRR